jgi:hypothetical protein
MCDLAIERERWYLSSTPMPDTDEVTQPIWVLYAINQVALVWFRVRERALVLDKPLG